MVEQDKRRQPIGFRSWATVLWLPTGRRSDPGLAELVERARTAGGPRALSRWLKERPDCRAACVHGERHSLWWEFRLIDSFRWQGHLCRLRPAQLRQRIGRLAARFGLTPLLERPVADLTAAERSLADLAVALLPGPDLLVWEEPAAHLSGTDRDRATRAVLELCRRESITVLVVAADPAGLQDLGLPAHQARRAAH